MGPSIVFAIDWRDSCYHFYRTHAHNRRNMAIYEQIDSLSVCHTLPYTETKQSTD